MCITLGYPDRASERALLAGQDRREAIHAAAPVMTPAELVAAQRWCWPCTLGGAARLPAGVDRRDALGASWFVEGLSPRAGIARAARRQGAMR